MVIAWDTTPDDPDDVVGVKRRRRFKCEHKCVSVKYPER